MPRVEFPPRLKRSKLPFSREVLVKRDPEAPIKVNRVIGKETPFWGIYSVQVLPFAIFAVIILMLYTIGVLPPIEAGLLLFVIITGWTILTRNKINDYQEQLFDKPPGRLIRGRSRYKLLKGRKIKTRRRR